MICRRIELFVLIYILIGSVAVNSDDKTNSETTTEIQNTPENQNTPEAEQIITTSTEKNEPPVEQEQQEEQNTDDTDNQELRPCTCGIFLSNKARKQKLLVDGEEPTLTQELEKKYPCTKLGNRQCQNECFQTMIKYLPKSGEIICGLINEDIYKLKAHLFIQNCDNKWHNSNLVAGREYCCKDAKPYTCPLK